MGYTLKESFKFKRYSTYRQKEDRECFYTLCPLFLTTIDLIKDNKILPKQRKGTFDINISKAHLFTFRKVEKSLPCANGRKFASKFARLAVTEGL